jgi:hypothetical protein
MRIALILSALLAGIAHADALPPPAAAPAALEQVTLMRVHGDITIDAEGRVTALDVDRRVPDAIAANVVRIAHGWRFHPLLVDGRPAAAKAHMRLVLAAQRTGDGYEARVDSVSFPGDETAERAGFARRNTMPPEFPPRLWKSGISGSVSLLMRVGADGRLEEVVAVQTRLENVTGSDATLRKGIKMLEASALDAARHWTMRVPADIATLPPERRTIATDVVFAAGKRVSLEPVGRWQVFVRAPYRDAPWLPRDKGRAALANAEEGGLGTVGTGLELVSDADGQPLPTGA